MTNPALDPKDRTELTSNPDYEPPTRPDNSVVAYLREHGPATRDELPTKPIGTNTRTREVVGRFTPPALSPGRNGHRNLKERGYGQIPTIYYLYGDERRAVRKFIAENTRLVHIVFDVHDNQHHLQDGLDPILWQMLIEEWEWGDWDVPECRADGGRPVRVERKEFTPPTDGQLTVYVDGVPSEFAVAAGETVAIEWESTEESDGGS